MQDRGDPPQVVLPAAESVGAGASASASLDENWGPLSQLPGNPMMWLLIWSELLVFGMAFIGFAGARLLDLDGFAHSQATLDRLAGAVNTMVLITSGLCAAFAVDAESRGRTTTMRLWIGAAMLLGVLFLLVKWVEYDHKFAHGIGLDTNNFFTLYFLITGFHAMHVVFGIVVLAIVGWRHSLANLETGTAFWHMVDLIWVILFPLIYLIR